MNEKKKILLLTTGGTIASMPGGEGLEPHRSGVMERELNQLRTYYDITVQDVMCLDSSNIRPEDWQFIARHIFENRIGFDGIDEVLNFGQTTGLVVGYGLAKLLKAEFHVVEVWYNFAQFIGNIGQHCLEFAEL